MLLSALLFQSLRSDTGGDTPLVMELTTPANAQSTSSSYIYPPTTYQTIKLNSVATPDIRELYVIDSAQSFIVRYKDRLEVFRLNPVY